MGDEWSHLVGRKVGRYRIDARIGAGGMAGVFAATHENRSRVALKFLDPALAAHPELRARFQREGVVANTVDHEGTVVVTGDGIADDGTPYLVMELLDGESLDSIEERLGVVPLPEAVEILRRLLDVLAAANDKGIVHRDLKPGNLFVTREGRLKVLDFGIARLRDGTETYRTRTGSNAGTPVFMAPEQARGKTREIDGRTDLWSAAATFFHLVSGQYTHAGSPLQVAHDIGFDPARSLAAVVPTAPASLVAVIDRALSLERDARFPDARAMRHALEPVVTELGSKTDADLAALVARRAHVASASAQSAETNVGGTVVPVDLAPCASCGLPHLRADLRPSGPLFDGPICASCVVSPNVVPCPLCGALMSRTRSAYTPDGRMVCVGCATRAQAAPRTPLVVWVVPIVIVSILAFFAILFVVVVWVTP
jgi:serine/threonine-protein kinase